MTGDKLSGGRELAIFAANVAAEKKAHNLCLLEVGKSSIIADFFLIATGNSAVQVHALADHLREKMKEAGHQALRIEGYREGWWVVMDYGSLVIHLFQPEARLFYDLERLWSEAPLVPLNDQSSPSST